ncbi:MAG: hypothetical protein KBS99_04805 [Prevotellaceae bacterium]|nr:hypothetical protein [Candidatus Colivivens caballi]
MAIKITKIKQILVSPTRYDWSKVGADITKGCYTSYEKAKAIYVWLAENISYDTSYSIHDADTAWKRKKGVCQAYCELFYRIGVACNLDVRIVTGHGRGRASVGRILEDHCWIVVNRNSVMFQQPFPEAIIYEKGQEHILDDFVATKGLTARTAIMIEPTWGAGVVEEGQFIKGKHDMSWFDVDPCWMIFTHYPKNPADQLLGELSFSPSDYKQLPYLHPSYAEYGFNAKDLLSYFIHTGSSDFPMIYPSFEKYVEFYDIPVSSVLRKGVTYEFLLAKKSNCYLAISIAHDFYLENDTSVWQISGNRCKAIIQPHKTGTMTLSIKGEESTNKYNVIIEYKIKM